MSTGAPTMPDPSTQDEITYCAVHTTTEASLRCIRCNRYMCIQCVVRSPVGYICRECARQHDDRFFNSEQADPYIIVGVCAVLSALSTGIVSAIGIPLLFVVFVSILLGGAISEASLRATQKRKGRHSAYFAAAGCVLGGISGAGLQLGLEYNGAPLLQRVFPSVIDYIRIMLSNDWSLIAFVGILAFIVYRRYRSRV